MKESFYKIFDLMTNKFIGLFCFVFFFAGMFVEGLICDNEPINDYHDLFMLVLPSLIPTAFFIIWFILAIIVLGIENFIIAPIEFVVYKLGIPKIKINVDVIWKYQQKN